MTISRALKALRVLTLATIVLGAFAGCQKYGEQKRSGILNETVRFYTSAIRWSDFQGAASAIRPREGPPATVGYDHLKGVRVLSNDYRLNASSPDALEAEMVAVFTYQLPSSASVRTATQKAIWWFDEETERWFLDGKKLPF